MHDLKYINCPTCKKGMIVMKRGVLFQFIGCNRFPFCDFRVNKEEIINNAIACPKCNIVMKKYNSGYKCPKCDGVILDEHKINNVLLYVDVVFKDSPKVYTYRCYANFECKKGDIIKIYNASNEIEEVIIDKDPYYGPYNKKVFKVIRVYSNNNQEKYKVSNQVLYVDVTFNNNTKVYTYKCPPKFNHKKGDIIKIYGYDNVEKVRLESDPYYDLKTDRIYKVLPIC